MVVHTCNPGTRGLSQEDFCEFQANLDYSVRPHLKKASKQRGKTKRVRYPQNNQNAMEVCPNALLAIPFGVELWKD